MKLTALVLILLFAPNVYRVNGQEPQSTKPATAEPTRLKIQKLQELEAQLEYIDALPDSTKVKTKEEGDSITIEWKETLSTTTSDKDNKSKTQTKTLSINFNELDIPDEYINEKIAASLTPAAVTRGKCGSLPGVNIRQIGITRNYELVDNYIYKNGDDYTISVIKPFVYDRASIPRAFWVLGLDKDSVGNVAPLLHDFLYRHGGVPPENQVSPYRKFVREDADKLFREVLKQCGVSKWKREAAYVAVRVGGVFSWKGR